MPELPEVETVRRLLAKQIVGKRISSVELLRKENLKTSFDVFSTALIGKVFSGVGRKGKYLRLEFEDGSFVMSHLKMEGKYFCEEESVPKRKHDLLYYHFDDGTRLAYNDVRKFGCFGYYRPGDPLEKGYASLGPEPFECSAKELKKGLSKRSGSIKEALLDQTLISGIGNIYDSETLFRAHISPKAPAKSMSLEQCQALIDSASKIMEEAMEEGGSTIRSYHPGEGINGEMQNRLDVYGKENEPCPHCHFPIRRIFQGGRSTYYCPLCQEVRPLVIGVTGPIHSGKSTFSKALEKRGFIRFDADACVHELYGKKDVRAFVKKALGRKAYVGKELNRDYVRQALANDSRKKKELEAFLYPLVALEAKKLIAKNKDCDIVLDVPLLVGSPLEDLCDAIVLLYTSPEAMKERLLNEGRDAEGLLKLNAHYPLKKTMARAAFIIENSGNENDLDNEAERLYQKIRNQ